MKISELYLSARRALLQTEDAQTAGMIARSLLCHYTDQTPEAMLSHMEQYVGDDVCHAVDAALGRLLQGEPLAYILEEWDFYGMRLHVTKDVLIPRDDTCAVTARPSNRRCSCSRHPVFWTFAPAPAVSAWQLPQGCGMPE